MTSICELVGSVKMLAKEGATGSNIDEAPFKGMSVILLGNLPQFPPVSRPYGALYVQSFSGT